MNRKPSMAGAGRPKAKKGTLKRLLKMLFKSNGKLLAVVFQTHLISVMPKFAKNSSATD